jgi:hypothetical protein
MISTNLDFGTQSINKTLTIYSNNKIRLDKLTAILANPNNTRRTNNPYLLLLEYSRKLPIVKKHMHVVNNIDFMSSMHCSYSKAVLLILASHVLSMELDY